MKNEVAMLFAVNVQKNGSKAIAYNAQICEGDHEIINMKLKTLIPMTDFVNQIGNMENYPGHEKALSLIYNYATFLKQPLKLEMFEGDNAIFVFEQHKDSYKHHINLNRTVEYYTAFPDVELTKKAWVMFRV